MRKLLVPAAVTALVLLALVAATAVRRPRAVSETEFLLDTVVRITAEGRAARRGIEAAFAEGRRLHALLNAFDERSDIGRVNAAAGSGPVSISPDTAAVLDLALQMAVDSHGAFDPTVWPLVRLWNITGEQPKVPGPEELGEAAGLVDYRRVMFDSHARTVSIPAGMGLDLGAIAKGYVTDRMVDKLRGSGIRSAIVDAGGNIYTVGRRPGGGPWRVAISHPRQEGYLFVLDSTDESVVTSADNQRYFVADGIKYHHLLEPWSGLPGRLTQSVTIVAAESALADALATAAFILGPEDGRALIERTPGALGIIVAADGTVWHSPALAGRLRPAD